MIWVIKMFLYYFSICLFVLFLFLAFRFIKYNQIKKEQRRLVIESTECTRKIIFYLNDFFDNDQQRIYLWLTTENPSLGNVTPFDMIKLGREKKLLEFIEDQRCLSGENLIH